MILSLRNKLQGTVAFILVGIIIIPFALFGIDSLFLGGGAEPGVATVNRVPITERRLEQAVSMQRQQILARLGDVDPSLVDAEQLRGPVLERLIRQEALRQKVIDAGMSVAPQSVQVALRDEPAFQTDGRFDRNRFEFLVRQMGYTPAGYLDLLKEELVSQQVYQALAYSEFAASHELDGFARMLSEERDFSYLAVPRAAVMADLEPDEESLRAFYEEHADRYVAPEKVVLEVIDVQAEGLAADIAVDEAEIQRYFQQEQAQRGDDRAWEIAHILLPDTDEVDETLATLEERLAAGDEFAELAREYSDDAGSARRGGHLGFGGEDEFPPEFVTALGDMQPSEVSAPVRTRSGVHLIKLLAVTEGEEQPDLAQEHERIVAELQLIKARERMIGLVDRLREQAYHAVSLRDVAEDLDVPYYLSEPISRAEGGEGVIAHPRVLSAAFSQDVYQDGFASEVIELAPDHVVVVKVEEKIPARQLEYAEVRDRVESAWRQTEAHTRVLAVGEQLLGELESPTGRLDELMEEWGLQWRSLEGVRRGDARLPGEVQGLAFNIPPDAADRYKGRLLPSGDYAIVTIEAVRPGELDALAAHEVNQLRAQLINERATRAIGAFEAHAVEEARVRLDR